MKPEIKGILFTFLVLTLVFGVVAQFSESIPLPEDIIKNQDIKGNPVYIQKINVVMNEKYKGYFTDFKEIDTIIDVGSTSQIIYSGEWSNEHFNLYNQLKITELDLLQEQFKEVINPDISDCQLNPKLPKCK